MSFILNSGRFGVTDPGLTLLQGATLWLDASDPGSDSQKAQNKGTGGTALDARLGSTTSVDTNDPLLLTHTGTNYLYLPGSASNSASAPDSAALDITGDIEIVMRTAQDDWTPSSSGPLMGKYTSPNRSYTLYLNSGGTLSLFLTTDGTTGSSATSSSAVSFANGQAGWVKVTYRTSDRRVQFFTAADAASEPGAWTQLGTDQTHSLSSIFSGTALLFVGATGDAAGLPGRFMRCIIRNGIGGTTVFDADFTANTNQSSFTESSSNAATVTINRATSGRKSVMVTRPVWLFGTDDYMEIADNALLDFALADSFTIVAVGRDWNTPASYGTWFAKRDGVLHSQKGYVFAHNSTAFDLYGQIQDGGGTAGDTTIDTSSATYSNGQAYVFSMIRNVADDKLYTAVNSTIGAGTTDVSDATLENTTAARIGRDGGAGTSYLDGEIIAVAVFRSALTSTQLGQIATYYGV